MALRPETSRSLERLKSFHLESTPETASGWKRSILKVDNLFLFSLLMGLCTLGALLIFVFNSHSKSLTIQKHSPGKENNLSSTEISLGEFGSMKTASGNSKHLAVIEYEVSLEAKGSLATLFETEQEIKNKKNRLRALVEMVVNNASAEQLRESELKSIKAAILENVSEIIGEKSVTDVIFSRFGMFEIPKSS